MQFLAGVWDMELSEASFLPGPDAKVHGSVSFEWMEQGAALVMRMGNAATPKRARLIPSAVAPAGRVLNAETMVRSVEKNFN